jgi:hypothetical protein
MQGYMLSMVTIIASFALEHFAKLHSTVSRSNLVALPKMYNYSYQSHCATRGGSSQQLEEGPHGTASDDWDARLSTNTTCEYFFQIFVMFLGTDTVQSFGTLVTIPRASLHTQHRAQVMPLMTLSRLHLSQASLMDVTTVRLRS